MSDPFDDWLRNCPDPVAVARGLRVEQMRLLRWNAPLARLLGITTEADQTRPEDVIQALMRSMDVTGERAQRVAEANGAAVRHGHHRTTWQFHDPSGKLLSAEVELTALPSLGEDAYCTHIRDIGAVLETQHELAASEARFRDLFEAASSLSDYPL